MVVKIKQVLSFIRFGNLALIAVYFFVFDSFLLSPLRLHLHRSPALSRNDFNLLVFDAILVTVIGYWLNDWNDRIADRENRPERFLVKFNVTTVGFLVLIGIPVLMAAVITLFLGLSTGNEIWMALYPIVLILLTVYARKGKQSGFLGNVLVSGLIAVLPSLLIIAEWDLFVNLHRELPKEFRAIIELLVVYSGLMFFSNLAREIVKDCQDIAGDRRIGAKSLPIVRGVSFARRISAICVLVTMGVQIFFIVAMTTWGYARYLGIAILGVQLIILYALTRKELGANFGALSRGLKMTMFLGIVQLSIYMLFEYSQIN